MPKVYRNKSLWKTGNLTEGSARRHDLLHMPRIRGRPSCIKVHGNILD